MEQHDFLHTKLLEESYTQTPSFVLKQPLISSKIVDEGDVNTVQRPSTLFVQGLNVTDATDVRTFTTNLYT